MATNDQRAHIYALQQFLIIHTNQVGYLQHRPMATALLYEHDLYNLIVVQKGSIKPDCSEMFTMICRMAGLKPPAGPNFPYADGEGDSHDIWSHLPHYNKPHDAHIGAGVAYGFNGSEHIDMVMEPDPVGGNPILFNHSTDGPTAVRYHDMVASFPAGTPVTFLDISPL